MRTIPLTFRLRHLLWYASVTLLASSSFCNNYEQERDAFFAGRCEYSMNVIEFEESALAPCLAELHACTQVREKRFSTSREKSEEMCWVMPLPFDPRFMGPCPEHFTTIERNRSPNEEDLLDKLRLRFWFSQTRGQATLEEKFKGVESYELIKRIQRQQPENDAIRYLLFLYELARDKNELEVLNMILDVYERDPDCPNEIYMLPDGIYRYLYVILENWSKGEESGSELTLDELKDLVNRSRRAVLTAYEESMSQNVDDSSVLNFGLASIHDAVLSGRMETYESVAGRLSIEYDDYSAKRRALLTKRLSSEYGINSVYGRSKSLGMMCNDYAFEIGLQDHCLHLIRHYGAQDQAKKSNLRCDLAQAATMVLNAVTRDCSETDDFLYSDEWWWNERVCFAENKQNHVDQLKSLVAGFPVSERGADEAILRAYLHLDGSSDENFLGALAQNDSMVGHASRIGARLIKLGKLETVSSILGQVNPTQFNLMEQSERRHFELVAQTHSEGRYANWTEGPRIKFLKDCAE